MVSRSGDAFFEESWARADSTALGGSWVVDTGDAQIVQETLKQSTSAAQVAQVTSPATSLAPNLGSEVSVQGVFACSDDAPARTASLLLRWDATNDIGYKVSLEWDSVSTNAEVLTLSVSKVDAVGTTIRVSTLGTSVVTAGVYTDSNGSYIDQFQNLRARIYDDSGAVVIEAKLNEEEEPLLRVTDREWPLFRSLGSFGVEFDEGESSPADGYILCDYLAIQGIGTAPDQAAVSPTYWTFGKLKDRARSLALRDSSSNINDDEWGDWVNSAIHEMFIECGQPLWAETIWNFKAGAGIEEIPLPPQAVDVSGEVLDTAGTFPVPIVREEDHRASGGGSSTGKPDYFRLGGDAGFLVLRPYPVPSSAVSYSLHYYRAPTPMFADSDVPEVPDYLCEFVVWGAVMRWSYRDGDRASTLNAERRWQRGLEKAKRIERRRVSRTYKGRIRSGLHMGHHSLYQNDVARSRYGIR